MKHRHFRYSFFRHLFPEQFNRCIQQTAISVLFSTDISSRRSLHNLICLFQKMLVKTSNLIPGRKKFRWRTENYLWADFQWKGWCGSHFFIALSVYTNICLILMFIIFPAFQVNSLFLGSYIHSINFS